jgi:hypothetical protein
MYTFEGSMQNNRINYTKVYYVARPREKDNYIKVLEKGDSLMIENRKVIVFKTGKKIAVIVPPKYGKLNPMPFIIQFE